MMLSFQRECVGIQKGGWHKQDCPDCTTRCGPLHTWQDGPSMEAFWQKRLQRDSKHLSLTFSNTPMCLHIIKSTLNFKYIFFNEEEANLFFEFKIMGHHYACLLFSHLASSAGGFHGSGFLFLVVLPELRCYVSNFSWTLTLLHCFGFFANILFREIHKGKVGSKALFK